MAPECLPSLCVHPVPVFLATRKLRVLLLSVHVFIRVMPPIESVHQPRADVAFRYRALPSDHPRTDLHGMGPFRRPVLLLPVVIFIPHKSFSSSERVIRLDRRPYGIYAVLFKGLFEIDFNNNTSFCLNCFSGLTSLREDEGSGECVNPTRALRIHRWHTAFKLKSGAPAPLVPCGVVWRNTSDADTSVLSVHYKGILPRRQFPIAR
mmetsp:Transcript_6466/g.7436  ORF Transcript_6466/g.7436 Transcript_6466/m.7436 type:complete len:207 (-) Transcript_6466:185-805(-)